MNGGYAPRTFELDCDTTDSEPIPTDMGPTDDIFEIPTDFGCFDRGSPLTLDPEQDVDMDAPEEDTPVEILPSDTYRSGRGSRGQFTNILFTLNNPTEDETADFQRLLRDGHYRDSKHVRFIVLQTERVSTLHYQGYIEFTSRRGFLWIKRNVNNRMNFERRRGTQAQAIAYSTKIESRVEGLSGEGGIRSNARASEKLKDVTDLIRGGSDMMEIDQQFPTLMLLHKDKIQDYYLKQQGIRDWAMHIDIFVGKTGSGKSRTAKDENPDAYNVPWPSGNRWWWPDYQGEATVIMDEFRHQIKYDVMLKMMDRYAWCLESKGRNFQFVSNKIVITTNLDPKNWYPGVKKEIKAPLARRINEFATIYDFNPDSVYPDFEKTVRHGNFEFADDREQVNFTRRQRTPVVRDEYGY